MAKSDAPNFRLEKRKVCPNCIHSKWTPNFDSMTPIFKCDKYDIHININSTLYYTCDSYVPVGLSFCDRFKLKIANKLGRNKKNAAR
jgi:hypothetical protein